jgi:acyl phosphate:glycerol-3-phosphate acyltransferase
VNQAIVVSTQALWLLVFAGYILGSIPFGYLLVRVQSGQDVRYVGSGNIGATNVARTAGWSTGIATLILDAAKGFLAVWLIGHFSDGNVRFMMYAGLAAILGHLFPVWLGFSGGRGVATTAGVFLAICWPSVAVAGALFAIVLLFWRYVSLSSVSAAAALPLLVYVLYAPGHAPPTTVSAGTWLAAILVIMKHRGNIERLMAGTEPRFDVGRKKS